MIEQKKTCTKCGNTKLYSDFYKGNAECKDCFIERSISYHRTIKGLITMIYSNQNNTLRTKKYPWMKPNYTKQELTQWLLNQDRFLDLYNSWVGCGYNKMLAPSIDRIDDMKGYTLDNIQLMTWEENKLKGHRERKEGKNKKNYKPVQMFLKSGVLVKEFISTMEAERQTGISNGNISLVCKNNLIKRDRPRTVGGYIWKYKKTIKI